MHRYSGGSPRTGGPNAQLPSRLRRHAHCVRGSPPRWKCSLTMLLLIAFNLVMLFGAVQVWYSID
jgi:hypothetical protein